MDAKTSEQKYRTGLGKVATPSGRVDVRGKIGRRASSAVRFQALGNAGGGRCAKYGKVGKLWLGKTSRGMPGVMRRLCVHTTEGGAPYNSFGLRAKAVTKGRSRRG